MKNKLTDLNNHLFEALERLNDDLKAEELEQEIKRSKAIAQVAGQLVASASLVLDAQKLQLEYDRTPFTPIALLGQKKQ